MRLPQTLSNQISKYLLPVFAFGALAASASASAAPMADEYLCNLNPTANGASGPATLSLMLLIRSAVPASESMPFPIKLTGSISYLSLGSQGEEEYTFYIPVTGTTEHMAETWAQNQLTIDGSRVGSNPALKAAQKRIKSIAIDFYPGAAAGHIQATVLTADGEKYVAGCLSQ